MLNAIGCSQLAETSASCPRIFDPGLPIRSTSQVCRGFSVRRPQVV
jgi:hypothetical protein